MIQSMRSMTALRLLGVAAIASALAFAAVPPQKKQGKAPAKKAAARSAGDKAKGQKVYKANCAVCHYADKADKRIGPGLKGLFKNAKMENGKPVNDANVREIILEGYGKMIPFKEKLDKQELEDLVAYLHTL